MADKFSKNEILLLSLTVELLDQKDKIKMQEIIKKMEKINEDYTSRTKKASERIMEIRKEDKWYGRSTQVIQNHFNTRAKSIKKKLSQGKSKEARKLYKIMIEEAKFPRHKLQFDNAVKEYLTDLEIEFLKRG